ncbi:TlpA family protein disulfide reductase [Testudinibacter sp. TR-2022]|uniref:TlpA family protein disulfide reductase n=1 Tax=Testudinibacter sp. TR-2022 TaxID=2585029 RepID=UPI00111A9298|nr:TlpA disulfide reductase family protein [Testudinibacter sp. TR-2022]TNH04675.1 TlpA family protein disulfide reductase [Pasteurellaceae bacterium Phil31]TNH08406.1 TlpA family protein disulfide reductase [Pasteurellaceae bacterium Phil11]TNH10129.1 TlpA family protein disulfide reductase [Testudinibacter sp. TR-2022]TNH12522.1 TlpA family protein disulfide reductase [Testudinibacter sp. TR-2022]TNH15545.1 TlpA family protein disulfide reductase [Testudinibacter sp. TR-2022]
MKSLLNTLTFSLACLLLSACEPQSATLGKPAPELATFSLNGETVKLENVIKQKPLFITFWSESCGGCIAEMLELQRLQQAQPDKLDFLAINIDGKDADTAAVAKQRGITLPVVKDQLGITAERYQVVGTPTSFLIATNGVLQQRMEGFDHERVSALFGN